jgi:hypothetical protein
MLQIRFSTADEAEMVDHLNPLFLPIPIAMTNSTSTRKLHGGVETLMPHHT